MTIDDKLVDKVARLSKLKFEAKDKEEVKNNLSKILTLVEKLEELDTSNVEPLQYMSANQNVLRKDEVKRPTTKDEALRNAASKDSDYIKVPKVLNK